MAECAALGVLTGNANRRAAGQERCKRKRLGRSPIDDTLLGDRRVAPFELIAQLAIELKSLGYRNDRIAPRKQLLPIDGRQNRTVERVAPGDLAAVNERCQRAFDRAARFLEMLRRFLLHRAHLIRSDDSLIDELIGEKLAHGWMILYAVDHLRLRVCR